MANFVTRFKPRTLHEWISAAHTRASVATDINPVEVLSSASTNTPAFKRNSGVIIEDARTQLLYNTGWAGLAAGTPGTAPTSWSFSSSGGTTATSSSTPGGLKATLSATAAQQVMSFTTPSLATSTTYILSVDVVVTSGSPTYENLIGVVAGGATPTVTIRRVNGVAVNATDVVTGTKTLEIGFTAGTASTVAIRLGVGVTASSTAVVIFNLPQLEAGFYRTSYIYNTATAATLARAATTFNPTTKLMGLEGITTDISIFTSVVMDWGSAGTRETIFRRVITLYSDANNEITIRFSDTNGSRAILLDKKVAGSTTTITCTLATDWVPFDVLNIGFRCTASGMTARVQKNSDAWVTGTNASTTALATAIANVYIGTSNSNTLQLNSSIQGIDIRSGVDILSDATMAAFTSARFELPVSSYIEPFYRREGTDPPATDVVPAFNLTTLGSLDWHRFGETGNTSENSKSGANWITSVTDIGTPAWSQFTASNDRQAPLYSYTDGTSPTTETGDRNMTTTGVNAAGKRYTISPAGVPVLIRFPSGAYNATHTITVSVSDSSAASYSITNTPGTATVGSWRQMFYVYTANPAATIQVDLVSNGSLQMGGLAVDVGLPISSLSDTTLTPGQSVNATISPAFASAATSLILPSGATIAAEAGANTTAATFIMSGLSTFANAASNVLVPWESSMQALISNGIETRPVYLTVVAPTGTNKYSDVSAATPYPADTRLPAGTITGARYYAEYTVGTGTFNTSGVASQSVLPASLEVRRYQAGSWSQIDTYNFALTDATPDAYSIPDVVDAELSTPYISVPVTPAGYNIPVTISISGGEYSINGAVFLSTSGTINPGESFRVRVTSSAGYNAATTAVVTIGGVASSYIVTTKQIVLDVNPFSIPEALAAPINTGIESAPITATGYNTVVPISIINGTYSINGAAFTSATGTLAPGASVIVKGTSSTQYDTSINVILTIGDQSAIFLITTEAAILIPNSFSFPSKTNVAISLSGVTSDPIAITGINSSVNVFVTGSASAQYSKNDGEWTGSPGLAVAGDIFKVRVNSSDSYATTTSASLTVGGVTATFSVTTISETASGNSGYKIVLNQVQSGYLTTTLLNENFSKLEVDLNENVLYRRNPENTANDMHNTLDMNSNRIINLPEAITTEEPITLGQALDLIGADNIAISGYAEGLISWAKGASVWTPTATFIDVAANFIQAGIVIASRTVRGILDVNTGNISVTSVATSGLPTTITITDNNTTNPKIKVVHTDSGSVIPVIAYTVQNGAAGADGGDGVDGEDGVPAYQYYIKPTTGTAIKNGVGTLTVEARRLGATADTLLASGDIKLYVGNTLVTLANGYVTGSDGYTGIFDSGDITDDVVVLLKDIVSGITYDTITLVDIKDGIASNATVGSVNPSNGLAWTRAINAGAWTPSQSYTDLVCTFYQGGAAIATETRRVTLNTSTGALTEAIQGANDANIDITVSGSTTSAITVLFNHTPTGIKIAETVHSAQSGSNGSNGSNGTNGSNAVMYYIKPINGTAIKNGVGNITIEAHKIDGASDVLMSSGAFKLYVGSTEVTLANGYQVGSNGYTGIFSPANINDSVVVSLKDGPAGTVYDTITLVDIEDGTGSNATTGSINTTNGLAWVRAANAGAWSPGTTTTDLVATFYQGGVAIATETQRVSLNTTAGTLTSALSGSNHADISVDVTNSGTSAITVVFTHVPSGAKVAEQVMAVQGGSQGTTGTPGTPGVNGVFYYIKPTNGTAIKNSIGTLTVEAHRVDGTADVLLSSGTIKLYFGTTELTTGNGYQSGSTGYIGVLNASNITESKTIQLKDGPNGTILDTITLIDVEDGTGSNATYGSVTPSAGLAWQKPTGGAWMPANTYTDLACIFYQGGVSVGAETRRVTLNTTNGTLSSALQGSDDANVSVTTTGSGTNVMTVTFTHVPSGAKVSETVLTVTGTGSSTTRNMVTGDINGVCSITHVSGGGQVSVDITFTMYGISSTAVSGNQTLLIRRNGSTIKTINIGVTSVNQFGTNIWQGPFNFTDRVVDTPGAGTHTYTTLWSLAGNALFSSVLPFMETNEIVNS